MSLSSVCAWCGLGAFLFGIVFAGAWEIDDYETEHKPMAQAMWADYEFRKCLDDCRRDQLAVCATVGIVPDECPIDCARCDVYKEKE